MSMIPIHDHLERERERERKREREREREKERERERERKRERENLTAKCTQTLTKCEGHCSFLANTSSGIYALYIILIITHCHSNKIRSIMGNSHTYMYTYCTTQSTLTGHLRHNVVVSLAYVAFG